jgi:hypothetical protein
MNLSLSHLHVLLALSLACGRIVVLGIGLTNHLLVYLYFLFYCGTLWDPLVQIYGTSTLWHSCYILYQS